MTEPALSETAWIEVIRKMDEVYADLIRYEVDLEEKNAALEQAQHFISSVLASMSDVLVVCDHKGRVQQVNQGVLDLTGLGEEALVGQPLAALLAGDDEARFRQACDRGGGGGLRDCELRLRAAGGGLTDPVAMNGSVRYDGQRRPAGLVLIGRPVGELRRAYEALNKAHADLKQAQQQLVRAEKMASLGRLVAGVAHELNNPISFVYGNIHTLKRYRERLSGYIDAVHGGVAPDALAALRQSLKIDKLMADLDPLIEGTLEGAERVSDIVKNLRRLSFVDHGDRSAVDLSEVVRTAVQWAGNGRRQRPRIDLEVADALWVEGHAGSLHQVVVNLVENAIDAAQDCPVPTIVVSACRQGGDAVLTVADNGAGIAADDLVKVFDPFFTTKAVGQGTGLGLWISYGIVRDHGGGIEAGNGANNGAVFTVNLPLVPV